MSKAKRINQQTNTAVVFDDVLMVNPEAKFGDIYDKVTLRTERLESLLYAIKFDDGEDFDRMSNTLKDGYMAACRGITTEIDALMKALWEAHKREHQAA